MTLLPYLQSPVGNRVSPRLAREAQGEVDRQQGFAALPGWQSCWFGSGTQALAAAVLAACDRRGVRKIAESAEAAPRVAVAGYGCPDLVSAIHFAGARPLYIDISKECFNLDLGELASCLEHDDRIVAIVGVELFGMPERWSELRRLADKYYVTLIQDNAQSLQPHAEYGSGLHGDFVVHSFGRGKPVYLQGGGALLMPNGFAQAAMQSIGTVVEAAAADVRFSRIKALAYNLLLQPNCYALAARAMSARLGVTRYKTLGHIAFATSQFTRVANAAIDDFWARHTDRSVALQSALHSALEQSECGVSIPADARLSRTLLRLPLIADNEQRRDALTERLARAGIGATSMYQRALPEIVADHSDDYLDKATLPVATCMAKRLFTVPVHARLRDRDIEAIVNVIKASE